MALDDLDGIANVTFSEVQEIAWDTAQDWDDRADEAGVVHEGFGDYPGDATIQLGWPSYDRGGTNLWAFYPLHEDSGSTVNDESGNGRDGSIQGNPNPGVTGLHGTTAWDWDGGNDTFTMPHPVSGQAEFTLFMVVNSDDWVDSNDRTLCGDWGDENNEFLFFMDESPRGLRALFNSIPEDANDGNTPPNNTWMDVGVTYGSNGLRVWNQGSFTATDDQGSGSAASTGATFEMFGDLDAHGEFDGQSGVVRWYDRELTATEMGDLGDTLTQGHLETATKSFSSPVEPDLSGLVYSLNSQSITLDVIGSPGTASEETVSQTLDGATGYTLTWGSAHTDFRVRINISTSDPTASPTFQEVTLST